jgi:hypothetical protein
MDLFPRRRALVTGFVTCLIATVLLGLWFRWQLAGWVPVADGLDLRRAHSHLGYYGVLFPLSWMLGARRVAPRSGILLVYFGLCALSAAAFLEEGYGPVSRAASAGILLVWLAQAWRGRAGLWRRDWRACAPGATVLAAALIGAVARVNGTDPGLAQALARLFLTVLLLGAFVPAALGAAGAAPPRPLAWLALTLCAGVRLTGLGLAGPAGGALTALAGAALLDALFGRRAAWRPGEGRLRLSWAAFALGLVGAGLSGAPLPHPLAIAGIHFLVLGPLLLTLVAARGWSAPGAPLRLAYEGTVVAMCGAIAWPHSAAATAAAALGTAVVLAILVGVAVRVRPPARSAPDGRAASEWGGRWATG